MQTIIKPLATEKKKERKGGKEGGETQQYI
jgi:hypothetical protein